MPATTTIPASPRQIRFINDLRAERGMEPMPPEATALLTGGRTGSASAVISDLQRQPVAREPRGATRVPGGSTQMPAPNNAIRAGRMLNGGGIDATVTLASGDHVTLVISTRVPRGRGWANGAPGDEGARTYIRVLGNRVGWINVIDGVWTLTLRTRNDNVRQAVHALFEYAASGDTAGGERVQEASRCGRCRRTLTDPVSIDRGIGPECWGRCTGSHHAEVRTESELAQADAELYEAQDAEQRYNAVPPQRWHVTVDSAARERAQEEAGFASDPDYRAHLAGAHQRTAEALGTLADAMTTAAPVVADADAAMERVSAAIRQGIDGAVAQATAARPPRAISPARVREARALIERALTALAEDELAEPAETRRALATFDQLAGS